MEREELIEKAKESAAQNFKQGLNCAESVYMAVYDQLEDPALPRESVALITGFGGGIGVFGSACGALLGGIAALGLVHGWKDPYYVAPITLNGAVEERVNTLYGNPGLYRFFNQLPNRFKQAYGNVDCSDLTEGYHDNWLCKEHAKQCMKLIIHAAGMTMDLLLEGKDKGYVQPFGENIGQHK